MGRLTWPALAVMLCARPAFSLIAQGIIAGLYAAQSSPAPWADAAPWLPVYATMIDGGCLALLWILTRREGITVRDLIGDCSRWRADVLLGLGLIPVCLLFILGGIAVSGSLVFGTTHPPDIFRPLPLPAAWYAVLVFPALWGLTEQMTYNGYLAPRLQVLSGSTGTAIALVTLPWSLQHSFQPMTFSPDYMLYRFLAPIPFSVFVTFFYLRVRRLLPLAIAHALMDGADSFATILLPRL